MAQAFGQAYAGRQRGVRHDRLSEQVRRRWEAARWEAEERWDGIRRGTVTVEATPPALARINAVMEAGQTDHLASGPYRVFEGIVGGERMRAQVTALGGDVVISFWSRCGCKARRLLVSTDDTGRPVCWLHTDGLTVFPHAGKYAQAATTILALRAHERETGILRVEGVAA